MTNPNTSAPQGNTPSPETNASTIQHNKRRNVLLALGGGIIAAALLIGSFALGQATNQPSQGNTTVKQQTSSASQIADTCDTKLNVVASVNQWGSLAKELGGSCVEVTSLINSTSADPHDYEATPNDLSKLSKAQIVVLNGAGYDGWAEKAHLDATKQHIVNVGDLMGITATEEHDHAHSDGEHHHHHHGSVNPHVWFNPEAVLKASQAITNAYIDEAGSNSQTATTVMRHSNSWNSEYADFVALVNKARSNNIERRYAATESVANYLLDYIGAVDKTPATYTNAMNNETEPSASDLRNAINTVSGPDVDILIVNPQEMGEFAKKLDTAAKNTHKTIISVSEQLPENQTTLLGWLTSITNQALANDTTNGYFLTQDVKNRTLADYAGKWQSVYPLLQNGSLDKVMEAKAKKGDMTEKEYHQYYDTGYRTDVSAITIQGNNITFNRGEQSVTATYRYDGFKILDYKKGNRGVRYLFTATGNVPQGAPKVVQFSDHGIAPGKAAHFHIFMGDQSQEETLKEMDNWPTYYPASMSAKEVANEMLAH